MTSTIPAPFRLAKPQSFSSQENGLGQERQFAYSKNYKSKMTQTLKSSQKNPDEGLRVIIDKIVEANGEELEFKASKDLCAAISASKSLKNALNKTYKRVYSNPKVFKATHKSNEFIYMALLKCQQRDSPYTYEDWDLKKYLFDKVKKLRIAEAKIYNIFIQLAWKQGKDQEANLALAELEEKGEVSVSVYNTYLDGAGKYDRKDYEKEIMSIFQKLKKDNQANVVTYNTFINNAKGEEYLKEAQEAFEEAKKLDLADAVTYTAYMRAMGKNGRFEEATKIFEEAKQEKKINEYTYNNYLQLASKTCHFQEVKEAFKALKESGLETSYSYVTYLLALGQQGEFKEIEIIFQEAKRVGKVDSISYTNYILLAGKYKKIEEIKEVFQEAKDNQMAHTETFNSFILVMGNRGDFKAAQEAFKELKNLKQANIGTFTNFIKVAGKNKQFQQAQSAFEEAKKLHLAGIAVYTTFIQAAGQHNEFSKAREAFKEIEESQLRDAIIFTQFIEAAGNSGSFSEANKAFEKAKRLGFADLVLFNTFIQVAGKYKEFQIAKEAFEEAKRRKIANASTYNIFMKIAAENGHFKDAETIFQECERLNFIDFFTYNTFMHAAGEKGDFQLLKEILKKTLESKMADEYTFTTFIKFACQFQNFQEARDVFSCSKNILPLNIRVNVYNTFIEKMGNSSKFQEAQDAFEEAKSLHIANEETYAFFIFIAGNNQKFDEAENAFREARELGLANTLTYSNFISIAGIRKDFEEVQEIFQEAKQLELVDATTYSIFMHIGGKHGKILEVKEAFGDIEQAGIADARAYRDFINFSKTEKVKDIEKVFKRAKDLKLADNQVYNSFIKIMGERKAFQLAKEAFEEAKRNNLADLITFATFIDIAGKNNEFLEAKQALQDAEEKQLVNEGLYDSYMEAARKNREYEEVMNTFNKVIKLQMGNPIIYSIFLKTLEIIGTDFKEIKRIFQEAKKSKPDVVIYSIFIRIAGARGKFCEAKAAFKEAKEKKLIDTKIYNQYIQAAGRSFNFQEAKNAFEESKKSKLADSFAYAFFIDAAARMAVHEQRKNLKLVNAASYLDDNNQKEKKQALEEPRRIFWEAQELGHLDVGIVNVFIHLLCQYQEFEEAEKILEKAENCQSCNKITRHILRNWSIHHSFLRRPLVQPLSSLKENDKAFIHSLMTPFYQLLVRLREFKGEAKGSFIEETKKVSSSSLSLKFQNKLEEKTVFVSREGDLSFEGTLQDLLKEYELAAEEQGVSIEYSRLVGGGVAWSLDSSYYKEALEKAGARSNRPFFDKETIQCFQQVCQNRFEEPDELDLKILLKSKDRGKISEISDALPKKIAKSCEVEEEDVKQLYFFKQCLIDNESTLYSLRRISDHQGRFIELIVGGRFTRDNIFFYDGLQRPIQNTLKGKKLAPPIAVHGTTDEAAIDYLLKRLRAVSPETINEYGWSTYVARLAQGCCCDDKDLELKLCQKISPLEAEKKVHLLLHGRDNHGRKSPEMGITMLFHACSFLCDNGFMKEAEELCAASAPLCLMECEDPFFRILVKIWLQKQCAFLEIRLLLESLGIFYLLSSTKKPFITCKINEHKEQIVMQLSIKGNHLLLPLAPYHTFNMLSKAHLEASFPLLQEFFNEWTSLDKPFSFSRVLSPEVESFLAIRLDDIKQIDDHWPELRKICDSLKSILLNPKQIEEKPSLKEYFSGGIGKLNSSFQNTINKWWE